MRNFLSISRFHFFVFISASFFSTTIFLNRTKRGNALECISAHCAYAIIYFVIVIQSAWLLSKTLAYPVISLHFSHVEESKRKPYGTRF